MQQKSSKVRLLIAGGGTGGHVFPAIAIANAFMRLYPASEVFFVGAEGRMEMTRVPEAGYRIEGLPMVGLPRRRSLGSYVRFLWGWYRSYRMARRLVKEFCPHVVVGVGGYASVPVMQVAQRLGLPTLIQEQNGYAGVANKLLARRARKICVAYGGMERFFPAEKIEFTGNPVRQMIRSPFPDAQKSRLELGLPLHGRVVLVVGGSLGARTLNEAVLGALEELQQRDSVSILLQTGGQSYAAVRKAVEGYTGVNLRVVDFISRMDYAYSAADLIVSRAGAIAISELCIVGKPVVLVPSPNVAEDHQRKNAEALVSSQAALMVLDSDAPAELMSVVFDLLDDPARCEMLSTQILSLAKPQAAARIAEIVYDLIEMES